MQNMYERTVVPAAAGGPAAAAGATAHAQAAAAPAAPQQARPGGGPARPAAPPAGPAHVMPVETRIDSMHLGMTRVAAPLRHADALCAQMCRGSRGLRPRGHPRMWRAPGCLRRLPACALTR